MRWMLLIEFSTHTHIVHPIEVDLFQLNCQIGLIMMVLPCGANAVSIIICRYLHIETNIRYICVGNQSHLCEWVCPREISNRMNATEMRKLIIWLQITQTSRMWNYKRNARKSTVFTFGTIDTEILWEVEFFCWRTKTLVQNPNFFFAYGPQFDIVDFCVWKISFYNGSFYCALFYT